MPIRVLARTLVGLSIILIGRFAIPTLPVTAQTTTYYVSPAGNDANPGTSPAQPFATIQHAVDLAGPGSVITLAAGTYLQDIVTTRSGTATAPITITGPSDAIVKGDGSGGRVIQIFHSYITLDGFTVDGKAGNNEYRGRLVYVLGQQARTPLLGLRIVNMTLRNAGGECVRLRYYIQGAELARNTIGPCGTEDYPGGVWGGGGKNGEGIYIGTAPEQQGDDTNPESGPDLSRNNHIHHNTFNTQGNECVDMKEHTSGNIIEYNVCTGQKDPNSGGFGSRGNGNILRFNTSQGNVGGGVFLGGDTESFGINNQVYGNTLHNNRYGAIYMVSAPQTIVCGNNLAGNGPNDGEYGQDYPPDATCPPGLIGGGNQHALYLPAVRKR